MILRVLRKRRETKNISSLILEKPQDFSFYPAQFIDVGFKKDTRIMSLSSSPSEKFLMFTFKLGISKYKIKLQKIKSGDILESSSPAGTYTLDENSPAVMLAGGVGVASHRSMIKWAVDNKLSTPITLIYSNTDSDFAFKKELSSWQKNYRKFTIHYVITKRDGRLNKEKLPSLLPDIYHLPAGRQDLQPIYYLAGPPSFVEDMEKILKTLGVDSTDIRLDSFDGYA